MVKKTRAMEGTNKQNLDLVREVLETRLDSLNEKIDSNNKSLTDRMSQDNKYVLELLTFIKEQTTKTNGKVIKLDDELKSLTNEYRQHLIMSASTSDIEKLSNRINKLDDDNFIIKVWNRYPKQILMVLIVSVLLSIATLGYSIVSVHTALQKLKEPNKQVIK